MSKKSSECLLLQEENLLAEEKIKLGGKARGLLWLKRSQVNVPRFAVISEGCFLQALQQIPWQKSFQDWQEERLSSQKFSEIMKNEFSLCSLNQDLLLEINQFTKEFARGAMWSVRSSVSDEDGSQFSFAGQMESHLYQKSVSDIEKSLRAVWASCFSERALEYRKKRKLSSQENFRMAVILQEMVDAEISGVAFSANPNTGSRAEVVISAGYGIGEGVVSGHTDCDEYVYFVSSQTVHKTVISKKSAMRGKRNGSGAEIIQLDSAQAEQQVLSDKKICELAELVLKIADLAGSPQDVEWAMSQDQFYILQTRAVTSEMVRNYGARQQTVFDNSNIQESYCGITLPLTFSFARDAYYHVYSQLMRVMNFSEEDIQASHDRHNNMLSYVRGRVYYNINSWYEGLKYLPSFGRNKADMERMMGVDHPVDFVISEELQWYQKILRIPQMLLLIFRLLFQFARIAQLSKKFRVWFYEKYHSFPRQALYRMNEHELLALIRATKSTFLENWATPIVNDFYVMMANGKVHRRLKSLGLEKEQPKLLFGEKLDSTEPTKRILHIVDVLRSSESLRKILQESKDAKAWLGQCRDEAPEFYQLCAEYIEEYGDRVIGELKLETVTLRQDPSFLRQIVVSTLTNPNYHSCEHFEQREKDLRSQAEQLVFGEIRRQQGVFALWRFQKDLHSLRRGIAQREMMRLCRTKVFGLFRDLYNEIGHQWATLGLIDLPGDIYYFSETEIADLIEGKSLFENLNDITELRKKQFLQFQKEEPPSHFKSVTPWRSEKDFILPPASAAESDGRLHGLGCFPGRLSAAVEVLDSAVAAVDLTGKILVTMRTDPGWAPLFVNIQGLIVERGSALSHSAIVARELGLPTIVGVPRVTQILHSGQTVEMDGQEGWIAY